MQTEKVDRVRYTADRPKECRHCYFWRGKRKGCSQKECYYLLPKECKEAVTESEKLSLQKSGETGDCRCCPYGRHSPCIGYCIQKIMWEMREKKQTAKKEGKGIAGRSK